MRKMIYVLMFAVAVVLSGCSTVKPVPEGETPEAKIARLEAELDRLKSEKDAELAAKEKEFLRLQKEQKKKLSSLEQAKEDLERSLKKELGDYKAKLEITERGLVITFLAEIFFNSGKDEVITEGEATLQKVAEVLNGDVVNLSVAVEGHTDNEPIKYSGWKTNWELSSARALSVVHYFIDKCGVKPERLSAIGYGEYRPITSNDTPEGRGKNRRVEIIVIPSLIEKAKSGKA